MYIAVESYKKTINIFILQLIILNFISAFLLWIRRLLCNSKIIQDVTIKEVL